MKFICSVFVFFLSAIAIARPADMDYPIGVAAMNEGGVFVADRNLHAVWKIQAGVAEVFFQGSKQFRTPLNAIRCLGFDKQGKLLAGDSSTREVYRFDETGKPVALTGGAIGIPMAIATDSKGDIYVADLEASQIYRIPADGGKAEAFVSVPAPRGLTIDQQDRLWIVSHGKDQILRVDPSRKIEVIVSGQPFQFPHCIVVGGDGTAFVSDGYGKCIWKWAGAAKPEKLPGSEALKNPVGLALRNGDLLVADPHLKSIFSIPAGGGQLTKLH